MSEVLVTLKSLPLHWAPVPLLAVYVRVTQAVGPPANSTTAAATGTALCSTALCTDTVPCYLLHPSGLAGCCTASKLHKSCLEAEHNCWTTVVPMSNHAYVLSLQKGYNYNLGLLPKAVQCEQCERRAYAVERHTSNRYAKAWVPSSKIGGAINWVNAPEIFGVSISRDTTLLTKKAMIWHLLLQNLDGHCTFAKHSAYLQDSLME